MLKKFQIDEYNRNGYLVLNNILSKEQIIDPIKKEYSDLLDKLCKKWIKMGLINENVLSKSFFEKLKISYCKGCDWIQEMDISLPGDKIKIDTPMHFSSAVFDMITCEKLLNVITDILGEEITSNPIQHIRLKPPSKILNDNENRAHITHTEWHQDRGVSLEDADGTQSITVWIAITDSTKKNGCLQVIKKNENLIKHFSKKQLQIDLNQIKNNKIKSLPVNSGGIILLHPLTPHSSLKNNSNDFRWSFDIRFNKTGEPTGREHFPSFIARSKLKPDKELKNWKTWKKKWELARKKLSKKDFIPIHRWENK